MAVGPGNKETHEDNKLLESVDELFSLPEGSEGQVDEEEEEETENDGNEDEDDAD